VSWPLFCIGNCVDKVATWNPLKSETQDPFLYIDLSAVDKDKKVVNRNGITEVTPNEAPSRARQLVRSRDVLVATVRPNLNGVAMVPEECEGATASTGYCVLRADGKILDSQYLYYWVQTNTFVADMMEKATGANYPAVSDKIIKESKIPLPPLPEQKRIAAILNKSDVIRRKRQQAIQLADEFLRAVFLDMFGDPVTNPKGWDVKPLKQLAKVTTGNTPSRKEAKYYGDHIEWIKSDNINTPSHFLTKASEYLSVEGRQVARVVGKGSTLVTCIAGSFDCIGNAAYADREVAFNQQINALTPLAGVSSWFLYSLILFSKKHIQSASTNSMKGMVSKGKMEEIPMICPPISLQERFQETFISFLSLNEKLNCSSAASSDVFNSLSQRAFSGHL
jgi:type I restriction enzyme S subunit